MLSLLLCLSAQFIFTLLLPSGGQVCTTTISITIILVHLHRRHFTTLFTLSITSSDTPFQLCPFLHVSVAPHILILKHQQLLLHLLQLLFLLYVTISFVLIH